MPHKDPTASWHRRARFAFIGGHVTLGAGLALSVGTLADHYHDVDWWRVDSLIGMLAISCGVVIIGISFLAMRGRSIEEAFRLGYDTGFEKGYDQGVGFSAAAERAVSEYATSVEDTFNGDAGSGG